ncbi:MAG: aromatic-ring-hydroxylating dioxygenase subunit beta [Rhodospirillaceae bacterium]|nr:aromatic-ring-hydroxylating dioxygenase subunit beta [Rhodospirillaceae bacterium]
MIDVRHVEQFLFREARLLDQERYEEWLALYDDECEYWVPSAPEQTDRLGHVSLFYEDRVLMETRVARLRSSKAHSLVNRPRCCRLVSNVSVEPAEEGGVVVTSAFHLLEFRRESRRLFGGYYTHALVPAESGFRIRSKRVDLVDCDAAHEVIETFI